MSGLQLWKSLPVFGMLMGLVLLGYSTTMYPDGYQWHRNTISALFQPTTLSGAENEGRWLAILGAVVMAVSMALVFHGISKQATSSFHGKTIQIAGIGSMVYGALIVTPMHNLMVNIALLFFLTAAVTILYMLYSECHWRLFALGVFCLAVKLGNAAIYYGNVSLELLPLVQKLSMGLTILWLFAVQIRGRGQRAVSNPGLGAL